MDFEQVFKQIGKFGKYQKFLFLLLCMVSIPGSFHNMIAVFIAGSPEHHCDINPPGHSNGVSQSPPLLAFGDENDTTLSPGYSVSGSSDDDGNLYPVAGKCSVVWYANSSTNGSVVKVREEPCKTWVYDTSRFQHTIVSDWNLVCGRAWMNPTAQSAYFLGYTLGCFVFGYISDRWGRLTSFFFAGLIHVVLGVAASFAPEFWSFATLRFLLATAIAGQHNSAYVLLAELVSSEYRATVGLATEIFWALGYIGLGAMAFLIRNWRHLQLVTSASLIILVTFRWLLPESPRWLLIKGRTDQAYSILKKIATRNGNDFDETQKITVCENKTDVNYNITHLFRTPRLRTRSLVLAVCWFVNSFVFYGLSLNSGNLAGNIFVNFCISGAIEIPGYILCIIVINKVGRRFPMVICMIVGGLACTLAIFIPTEASVMTVVMAMVGKFCITCSYGIIIVYTAELMPTVVRTAAFGGAYMCARIGGAVAPYIAMMQNDERKILPLIIFGSSSVIAGFLLLWVPETYRRPLPDTIEEGENFGVDQGAICSLRLTDRKVKTHAEEGGEDALPMKPDTNNVSA